MNVGLPGTGLGGIFYLFCVIVISFKELINLIIRNRNKHKWKIAKRQLRIMTGIIGSMLILDYLLSKTFTLIIQNVNNTPHPMLITNASVFILSISTLVIILSLVYILKFFIKPQNKIIFATEQQ